MPIAPELGIEHTLEGSSSLVNIITINLSGFEAYSTQLISLILVYSYP